MNYIVIINLISLIIVLVVVEVLPGIRGKGW